ncbi:MAG: hypothetical protein LCH73_10365 [Proteobacteria bacterium]|nr:hypothetical protein [Pseudomonadota bacterium]
MSIENLPNFLQNLARWVIPTAIGSYIGIVKIRHHVKNLESKYFDDRHEKFMKFFEAGGIEQMHPMLIESGIAAATGSSGLSAPTIRFLLRPTNPSQAIALQQATEGLAYLDVDRYSGIVSLKKGSNTLRTAYFIVAALLVGMGGLTIFATIPDAVRLGKWDLAFMGSLLGPACWLAGFFFVRQAARVGAAIRLTQDIQSDQARQSETEEKSEK